MSALAIASPLHLPHFVQRIRNQVRQSPVQVHRGQAALVAVPRCDQLGKGAVHVLCHSTDIQLSCKREGTRDLQKKNILSRIVAGECESPICWYCKGEMKIEALLSISIFIFYFFKDLVSHVCDTQLKKRMVRHVVLSSL